MEPCKSKHAESEPERRGSFFDVGTPESKHSEEKTDLEALAAPTSCALAVVDIEVPAEKEIDFEGAHPQHGGSGATRVWTSVHDMEARMEARAEARAQRLGERRKGRRRQKQGRHRQRQGHKTQKRAWRIWNCSCSRYSELFGRRRPARVLLTVTMTRDVGFLC